MIITKSHLVCTYNDNLVTLVYFTKTKMHIFDKINKLEPKLITIDLFIPNGRRLDKKVQVNKSADLVSIPQICPSKILNREIENLFHVRFCRSWFGGSPLWMRFIPGVPPWSSITVQTYISSDSRGTKREAQTSTWIYSYFLCPPWREIPGYRLFSLSLLVDCWPLSSAFS